MVSLRQGQIFLHKVMDPAQAARGPYPLIKRCSRSRVHSPVAESGWRDCKPFPTYMTDGNEALLIAVVVAEMESEWGPSEEGWFK